MARLKDLYFNELREKLKNKFELKNIFEVPKIEKIVVNIGVGEATVDSKKINSALEDLTQITGQKPQLTQAKKSIAGFKLRKGLNIGCKVTLRRNRMYEFLDRLIYIALPRVRDFKGLSKKSFDGNGNYSIGIKEQIIFPEINYDKIDKIRGMDICIVTNTSKEDYAYELLKGFNLPFKKLKKGGLMSKLSLIERNKKRIKLYKKYKAKHDTLLKQANNKKLSPEEQFQARLKLSKNTEKCI